MKDYKYCPKCGKDLVTEVRGGYARRVCPDAECGFVYWNNPAPVVAAIVEYQDKVLLVRSIGWPKEWFGLVTGFLEQEETPEGAVLREVKEETGLWATLEEFIGIYPFFRMNQLILAYHVKAEGVIALDKEELEDYKLVPIEQLRPWPMGTGVALRDWLRSRGFERDFIQM